MSLFQWANARIQKLTWVDMAFTKISVMAFILTVAKLWPSILGLDWYWYGIAFLLLAIRPLYQFFKN
jgi:hypothetical protein